MRLTMQSEYAIRAMVELARLEGSGLISAKELAAREDIPAVFLTKIVSSLSKAGLLLSQRGARGGIKLIKEPSEITVREIVEAIEGPMKLNVCLGGNGTCDRKQTCKAHLVWKSTQESMLESLNISLKELV